MDSDPPTVPQHCVWSLQLAGERTVPACVMFESRVVRISRTSLDSNLLVGDEDQAVNVPFYVGLQYDSIQALFDPFWRRRVNPDHNDSKWSLGLSMQPDEVLVESENQSAVFASLPTIAESEAPGPGASVVLLES